MIIQNQTITITFDPSKLPNYVGNLEPFKRTFHYKRLHNPPPTLVTWEVRVKELGEQLVGIVCRYVDPFYKDTYGPTIRADRKFWIGYSIQQHRLPVIAFTRKEVTKKLYMNLD